MSPEGSKRTRGVLVSGATTPLGRAIIERLVADDRGPVMAIGLEAPDSVRGTLPDQASYHQVDITRPRRVRQLLFGPVREAGVQAVMHLAMHRRASVGGPQVHRLNVDATRLMLRLAENHPSVRRFILCSSASVYRSRHDSPDLLREDQPVNLSPAAPQWIRDRVEADVTVCARMGLSPIHVNVLRCAEILAPDMGSQLHDYLSSRVCLRPLGFDPILNLLSLEDAARAFLLALDTPAQGVINIPGADTLPLSRAIRLWGRDDIPLPGPLLGPLYRWRRRMKKTDFRYSVNQRRFHYNGVLDGTRARDLLGYRPEHPLEWPCPDCGPGQPSAG